MPFWVALSLFLPPFALIAYSVLIVIDSTPDVFPPETILVEGEVDRWEALENYSPLGDKGIIYLAEHDAGYSVQEALGYGFGDIVAQLGAGEAVSLQVNADDMVEENQRVAAIADAIQNADTEGDYDVIVSQAERTGSLAAIPILELNIADETIYSRLQLIATARERIRNWALLGLAALFFLIVVARMRAD